MDELPSLSTVRTLLQLIDEDNPEIREKLEASPAFAALVDWLRQNFYEPTIA